MKRKQSIKPVSEDPMPLKIGVMGGAGSDIPAHFLDRAAQLGEEIAAEGCIMITGACPGLPLAAAQGAFKKGGGPLSVFLPPLVLMSMLINMVLQHSPTTC